MKQECHAHRSATKHLDGWREDLTGETPQVVEETPEEYVRHMLSPLSALRWVTLSFPPTPDVCYHIEFRR